MSLSIVVTSQAVSKNPDVPKISMSLPVDNTYMSIGYFYCQVFLISPLFFLSLYNFVRMFLGGGYKDIKGINRILIFAVATEPIRVLLDMLVLPPSYNAAVLVISRIFRIINLSSVNYYTCKRAFAILPMWIISPKAKPIAEKVYNFLLAASTGVYFVLNLVQFVDKTLVPLTWYNPFRTGYTIFVLATGISCNLIFMTTLLKTITLGVTLDLANVLVYVLPIGTMLYYVLEKLLGFANYNYIPGYSMPLDECNNLAFLSITVDLYLIFGVLEHLKSKSTRNSGSFKQNDSRRGSTKPNNMSILRTAPAH
ncbi:hypothetical protein EDD86DRAFT_276380 [Gorgonomyces haynaldii]|nr:hypothetical protein EDD86DRAFT_276380 [Gorgonomyces haynaldii]